MADSELDQELLSYAQYIGIDAQTENNLMWIARKGCHQPLPAGWSVVGTDDHKDAYFYEESTGKTQWEHPLDAHFRQMVVQEREKIAKQWCGEQTNESMLSPIPENSTSSWSEDDKQARESHVNSPLSFSPDSRSSPFHCLAYGGTLIQDLPSPANKSSKNLFKNPENALKNDLRHKLFENTMARISIEEDQIIRRNWMEYCSKSTESYASLLEQFHLF